ncbi:MAG: formate/nitrite transporter family protein [Planctomycetes bacterium]|nr:formate/nitrite transporter family protein [Planctomycetota bacterium]
MAKDASAQEQPPLKSYRAILQQQIITGLIEVRRPSGGLLLSSLSAGLDVGFSVLLMGVATTLFVSQPEAPAARLLVASMYSVGFILVILGRSELFTEHTALAVLPVLDGRSNLRELARVWGIVYAGNLAGAAIFAGLVVAIAPSLRVAELTAFERLALEMTDHAWWVILLSAMLAGWLMGELAWIIAAARDTISQVAFVFIVTTAIGLARLHHVVVGTAEVLAGMWSGDAVSGSDFARFLIFATLGNALGGVVFVAVIKYGHAMRAGPESENADDLTKSKIAAMPKQSRGPRR